MSKKESLHRTEHVRARKMKLHKLRKKKVQTAIIFVFCFLNALLFLMPIVLTITNSFMTKEEISANYGTVFLADQNNGKNVISEHVNLKFIPDMVSVSQYYTVLFKSPDYLMKFWNSVILVVPITIFQILVAVWAAYGLSRYKKRWKEIVFFAYIVLMLMPYQVTQVPNYLVSDKLGILNTNWAIWLPGIFSPFSVYMLTKYMRRIPSSIMEAASIDGCNEWQTFWRIAFPMCKAPMFSVAILVFIDYWNMVEQPIILLSDQNKHPLSVFLSKINSGEIGLAFAVACIYMFLPMFVFLYGENYLVEGMNYAEGVKG